MFGNKNISTFGVSSIIFISSNSPTLAKFYIWKNFCVELNWKILTIFNVFEFIKYVYNKPEKYLCILDLLENLEIIIQNRRRH